MEDKAKNESETKEKSTKEDSKQQAEIVKVNTTKTKKEKDVFSKKTKKTSYISFEDRIIVYALLILLCLIASTLFLSKSLTKGEEQITYQEKSSIDYKVYLKKNDFYEKDYLEKNMVYVASLIKKIDVDFNYLFDIDEKSNIEFDYDIAGTLVITDHEGKNTFFEKEYNLLKNTTENINIERQHAITKRVSIDYDYYNNLANKFRADYGIEASSNLIVSLRIHQKGNENNNFDLDNNSTMSITIPLSQKAVNIKMDYKEVNKNSQIFSDSTSLVISNSLNMCVGLALLLIAIALSIPLVKLLLKGTNKKSVYDKQINKILKEYDRLIVETTTAPNTKGVNIIEIDSFNELLDVRDNLNLPIKYYVIAKHQKCNFYINHEKELYLLVIKAVDLEKEND